MNLVCPKCQKVIPLSPEKLPQDKAMAMVKCPGCGQIITFNVPKIQQSKVEPPSEPKTELVNTPFEAKKTHQVKLVEIATRKEYRLPIGRNVIGRTSSIAIDNGDKYISRKHCLIEVIEKNGRYDIVLLDDGSLSETGETSTNGTFYNGARLTKHDKIYLSNGDKLRIGRTEFILRLE